jgi:hypothetical protein
MVFGGSLNSNGTDYLKELRKIENVIAFLEKFKDKVERAARKSIDRTIEILVKYGNKLVEQSPDED